MNTSLNTTFALDVASTFDTEINDRNTTNLIFKIMSNATDINKATNEAIAVLKTNLKYTDIDTHKAITALKKAVDKCRSEFKTEEKTEEDSELADFVEEAVTKAFSEEIKEDKDKAREEFAKNAKTDGQKKKEQIKNLSLLVGEAIHKYVEELNTSYKNCILDDKIETTAFKKIAESKFPMVTIKSIVSKMAYSQALAMLDDQDAAKDISNTIKDIIDKVTQEGKRYDNAKIKLPSVIPASTAGTEKDDSKVTENDKKKARQKSKKQGKFLHVKAKDVFRSIDVQYPNESGFIESIKLNKLTGIKLNSMNPSMRSSYIRTVYDYLNGDAYMMTDGTTVTINNVENTKYYYQKLYREDEGVKKFPNLFAVVDETDDVIAFTDRYGLLNDGSTFTQISNIYKSLNVYIDILDSNVQTNTVHQQTTTVPTPHIPESLLIDYDQIAQ